MIKKEWPEEGDLVIGTVKNVQNFGAFVLLDEYQNKEGFIHIGEIATGWVKRIRNHIKEKQKVVCKVMNVDEQKGHIDLSLKRVNEHQRRDKIQIWKNANKAEKLIEMLSKEIDKSVEQCYKEFANDLIKRYGTLYAAFEEAAYDIESVKKEGFTDDWVDKFEEVAKSNITIPFVNIKGFVKIRSFMPDGIKHISRALENAEKSEYDDVEIHAKYIGAPNYMITVKAPDYKIAEDELKKSVNRIEETLTNDLGECEFHRKLEDH